MHKDHKSIAGVPGQDPTLPDVSLVIGDKERHLCFDFNAICTVKKLTGINPLTAAADTADPENLRAILLASLLRDDPLLTLDEVGSWITFRNWQHINNAIATAWFASIDETDTKDEQPGEAPAQA